MERSDRQALLSLPAVLVAAAALGLAGSQGGVAVARAPVFAAAIGVAFLMQWIAFVPAYLAKSERFFDLTGSMTYLVVTALAVALSPPRDARSFLLLGLVAVWGIRLGSFLFRRVRRSGKDARFDKIKRSFPRFLQTWTLQGLWVSFTLAAALAAITASVRRPLGLVTWIGLAVWLVGFGIEAVADAQKSRFRSNPANRGRFIGSGLWAWSRHPNYFGEIVLWTGIALIATPVLRGWQWVSWISPVFVALLLTRISGIPMLEKRGDEKWGGQEDYEAYKRRTSILVPWPPRR